MNDDETLLEYPTDQVVGIVPDEVAIDGVVAALRDLGVEPDRITVLSGPRDADLAPRPSTEPGFVRTIVQIAQNVLGDEAERLRQLEEALRAGHDVLAVRLAAPSDDEDTREREKADLGDVLRAQGVRDVAFYGEYQIEQLDPGATS